MRWTEAGIAIYTRGMWLRQNPLKQSESNGGSVNLRRYPARDPLTNRIQLFSGDITSLAVDAIVNAANETLIGGAGVDGAIHAAAGSQLVAATRMLSPCPPGNARITPGFNLKADYVIHAVGPIYRDGKFGEIETFKQTYESALNIAAEYSLSTISFPCISTGAYMFPQDLACEFAIETVVGWQKSNQFPRTVVFCCFEEYDTMIYTKRLDRLGLLIHFAG